VGVFFFFSFSFSFSFFFFFILKNKKSGSPANKPIAVKRNKTLAARRAER
jgi:hypothetical protein